MLEPDPAACAREKNAARPDEHWFQSGFAGTSGKHALYVLGKPSGSSLYPPNPPVIEEFATESYRRLDKVVEIDALSFSDFIRQEARLLPNLIKLDTQGSELDILRSLEDAHWSDLLAVQTEIEFIEMYKGQHLFADVDHFMKSKGFILYYLLPVRSYRSDGDETHYHLKKYLDYLKKHLGIDRNRRDISCRPIAGDAFYLRPLPEVLATRDIGLFSKAFLILLIYRCLDEALWLVETGHQQGLLSRADLEAVISSIRAVAPRPSLRQRTGAVGKWARKLYRWAGIGQAR